MRPQRGLCGIASRRVLIRTVASFLFAGLLLSQAKDVALYKITKGIQYEQTSAAAPTVLTNNGYVYQADVDLRPGGSIRGAIVKSLEGTVRTLTVEDSDTWEFRNRVNAYITLETRYPDGNFAFSIDAVHDGMKNLKLPLTGNLYPNAPRVLNFSEMGSANANGSLVVMWAPFSGGTVADLIQLRIEDSNGDKVFETPDFGEAGALAGTATYAIVGPQKLKPANSYSATIRFEKTSARDDTSYTGVPGWSTYYATTRFTILTTSAAKPELDSYEVAKGRSFEQLDAGPPVADHGDDFLFDAKASGNGSNFITSASIITPSGSTIVLLTDTNREDFQMSDSPTNQVFFESTYPDGTYTFKIQTASQGSWSLPLSLTSASYPPAPRIYFDPTQKVPANRELVISWNSWPNGNGNDFIQLRVLDLDGDKVFETPDFGEKGALNGYANYAIVPAGKLKQAQSYKARLYFRRIIQVDTAHYPGALGVSDYYSRLKFKIETAPPDVQSFGISKGIEFYQTTPDAPVANGYTFAATIVGDSPGAINTATITSPSGTTVPLTVQMGEQTFTLLDRRTSKPALEAAYPDGTYTLNIDAAHDGTRSISIPLTGGAYPNPPHLNNFVEAGQFDSLLDNYLRWDPFEGGGATETIQCDVRTTAGGFALFAPPLTGFETELPIPAESLFAGQIYKGTLRFEKTTAVDTNSYPPATGRASYYTSTQFSVATIGLGNPAALRETHLRPDGKIEFLVDSMIGANYRIEGSSDLVHWNPITILPASDFESTCSVPLPASTRAYFFRAVLLR